MTYEKESYIHIDSKESSSADISEFAQISYEEVEYSITEFIRVRSVKDIVITFSLIIAGSIFVALPTSQSINVMDIINELEKMGDFIINISQDLHKSMGKVS